MRDLTGFEWISTTFGDVYRMSGKSALVVKFDVPVFHPDARGVTIQTVSGGITEIRMIRRGTSLIVRFAVEGDFYTVRPDYPVSVWKESI